MTGHFYAFPGNFLECLFKILKTYQNFCSAHWDVPFIHAWEKSKWRQETTVNLALIFFRVHCKLFLGLRFSARVHRSALYSEPTPYFYVVGQKSARKLHRAQWKKSKCQIA